MSRPDRPPPAALNASSGFFRHPWVSTALLAAGIGMIDTFTYDRYGVFTSNQAGNLVILGENLRGPDREALLSGLSLLGAALGVIVCLTVKRRMSARPWRAVAVPMVGSCLILAGAAVLQALVPTKPELMVPVVAFGLAGVAAVLLGTMTSPGWLTANTGSYLASAATLVDDRGRPLRIARPLARGTRSGITITVGFVSGAALYGSEVLGPNVAVFVALIPFVVTILFAIIEDLRDSRDPGGPSTG